MKVLIVHFQVVDRDRNTIQEHLYSFKRYSNHNVYYLNAFNGIPPFIDRMGWDCVIYHYTFLSQKWNGPSHFKAFLNRCRRLKKIECVKVAMPQDEYVHSDSICQFLSDHKVNILYTCLESSEWNKVYPFEKCGIKNFMTNLTGYVDEKAIEEVKDFYKPHSQRSIDIGYRARKTPYWLGEHGTIKWKLAEVFQKSAPLELKMDISNDENKVFKGGEWYRFLANCRVVLGCEGGASLHDPSGKIRQEVNTYLESHPDASFDEVRDQFFCMHDNNLKLFAISPRHFEACMTRTTQVLVEGDYFGIFKPNIHYIPLRKDFSNLSEVLQKIMDQAYCEALAEKAYADIIQSGNYTYKNFVEEVFQAVEKLLGDRVQSKSDRLAELSYALYSRSSAIFMRGRYPLKAFLFRVIDFIGLAPFYRKWRAKLFGWEM